MFIQATGLVYHHPRGAVSHHALACISSALTSISRQSEYIISRRLYRFRIDDIPQQVADSIQGLRLDLFTKLWYNKSKKGGVAMIFNTHNRTPKIQTNKMLKIMLISCWSFMAAFFLFFAIATSVMRQSILPAVIILIPITLIAVFAIIITIDMNKAYVQIDGESIIAVDYYFFLRKEKCFTINEIKTAEIALGYSFRVRGYRYSMMGFSYIVFRNADNKYLFKIINCPETKEYFCKYFQIK